MAEEVKKDAVEESDKTPRRKYRNDEWTDEQVAARKAELTKDEIPAGWITMASVGVECQDRGIAVSRLVRCSGGDRGMNPPLDPIFGFVYAGRTRYMAPAVLTRGMELLENPEFAKTQRKKKAKAEGEGEADAPVKKKATTRKKTTTVKK